MIENPRPTRHLEHIEPSRVGTPLPGSPQVWAAASVGDPETPDGPPEGEPAEGVPAEGVPAEGAPAGGAPAGGEPAAPSADGTEADPLPDQARSRLRTVVAGAVALAVVAAGIGGVIALRGDRPADLGEATTVAGALELPAIASGGQPSDGATGLDERVVDARTRLADAVEDGEATHAQAAARSAQPSAALRDLRRALDAGEAALETRPPDGASPESRTVAYLKTLEARRSAILDAAAGVADALPALPGPAAPWSTPGYGSDGTAATGSSPDQGGAGGGGAGTGGSGGGGSTGGGSEDGGTGGTGSDGGGTTTPTDSPPSPTAGPTPEPSTEPSSEPSTEPTPDPSASPSATPEPPGAPQTA
ncbi:hypothetical protein [Promicromonospora sp. NPDC023987]|uniref:hypothetical protein n=1 Tax=Promicromonospora sp. NPDC023987 TaxID=3155360 RepID=UPI0033D48CCC